MRVLMTCVHGKHHPRRPSTCRIYETGKINAFAAQLFDQLRIYNLLKSLFTYH